MKKRGILKTLTTLGLSGILAFGAGIFAGCNDTPDSQPDPKPNPQPDPKPDSSKALEKAILEFNGLVSDIATAKSLTAKQESSQETITIELDGDIVKRTEDNLLSFVETTTDGNSFEYTLQEDGYHKSAYTGSLTASATQDMIVAMMNNVTWTAVDENGKLSGTQAVQQVESTYVATGDNKSITFTTEAYTITINNINNTLVTLPEVAVDETQKQEFKAEEHIQEIFENVKPVLTQVEQAIFGFNTTVEITKFYGVYLKSSDGTTLDTIGALFNLGVSNGEYLRVTEVKLPVEDLTYEKIYNGLGNFKTSQLKPNQFFSTPISQGNLTNLQENRCKIVFGEDYAKDATNFSYNEFRGVNWDDYTLIKLIDGKITKQLFAVRIFNTSSMNEALEKYYTGEPSEETWKIVENATVFDLNEQTNVLVINIDNSTENTELDR